MSTLCKKFADIAFTQEGHGLCNAPLPNNNSNMGTNVHQTKIFVHLGTFLPMNGNVSV